METQIEKIFEVASTELAPSYEKIEPTANLKMQNLIEKCYEKNAGDPSNFAGCVLEGQNKITSLM